MDHVSNIQPLLSMLNEEVPNQFELKVIKNNQIKIQPLKSKIYSIIIKELTEKKTQSCLPTNQKMSEASAPF